MNKFIYKVGKWLENPDSVRQEERCKNKEEAANAAYAVAYDYDDDAAYHAAYFAAENNPEAAIKWVNKYFEVTGEDKKDYINAIEEEK